MKKLKWMLVLGLILIIVAPVAGKGPGAGGGGGDIPDTGELYGDLYVILRDENGVPMLNDNGCIQPISSMDDTAEVVTIDGVITITAVAGEPFTLATYIDTAGDAVDCELTPDMADWVQAVDFGRLNLGRAPDSVVNHAFDEAIKNINLARKIGIEPAGRLVLTFADGTEKTIDAPAENLALYIKMMKDGHWITMDTTAAGSGKRPPGKGPPEGDGPSTEPRPVLSTYAISLLSKIGYGGLGDKTRTNAKLTNSELLLAGSLLAAAADKTGNITLDKVVYINSVYGINQTGPRTVLGADGKTYFAFGTTTQYARERLYSTRSSGTCAKGWIWVLQPELRSGVEVPDHFVTQCMEILGYEKNPSINAVRFTHMVEEYKTVPIEYDFIDNVRAFTQASDDALQVLEYLHNYKVPEVLYPAELAGAAIEDSLSLAPAIVRRPK